MKKLQCDCCIVGGGPGGLFLALLLVQSGKRVVVLEKQKEYGKMVGGAILQPGILHKFRSMGLLPRLAAGSQRIEGVIEYGWEGKRLERDYEILEGLEIPYSLAVPQVWLRTVLLKELSRYPDMVQLMMNSYVMELRDLDEERFDVFASVDGEEHLIQANVIVGADGKFSSLRELAGIPTIIRKHDEPHLIFRVRRPADWPHRIVVYHAPRFMLTVPTKEDWLYVFYPVTESECTELKLEGGLRSLRDSIAAIEFRLGETLDLLVSWEQINMVFYHFVEAATWRKKNVVLMGDSAHSVHSIGGQGMNLALQDAVLLSGLINEVSDGHDLKKLDEYERIRKPFVKSFQQLQQQILRQYREKNPEAFRSLYLEEFENLTLGQKEIRSLLLGVSKCWTSLANQTEHGSDPICKKWCKNQ